MDTERPLHFYVREDGIMVFEFKKLERKAADLFVKITSAGADQISDRLRMLYDVSKAEFPTPYFVKVQGKIYNEFPHPEDEKSAYVTGPNNNSVWIWILRNQFLHTKDTMRVFTSQEEAIKWLNE
jgi:hypothetical protein